MRTITLDLTYKCNLRCEFCYNLSYLDSEKEMSREKVMELASQATSLNLGGGEPLLYPNFEALLEELLKLSQLKHIILSTNGTFKLNGKLNRGSDDRLQLQINLPSLEKEKYSEITGRDGLNQVLENIKYYQERDFLLLLNVPLYQKNEDEIKEMVNFAEQLALPLRFHLVKPLSGKEIKLSDPSGVDREITSLSLNSKTEVYFNPAPNKYCSSCSHLYFAPERNIKCIFAEV